MRWALSFKSFGSFGSFGSFVEASTVLALCAVGLVACTRATDARPNEKPSADDRSSTQLTSASMPRSGVSTEISGEDDGRPAEIAVPGDRSVLVVQGSASVRRPIVHLHGMCVSPRGTFETWGRIAREHGTSIALFGDVSCNGAETKWSDNADAIDKRIVAAIQAVNAARGLSLDPQEIVLLGESMGAARAESLAAREPERYRRLVLVGSPQTPSAGKLKAVHAVATMAGEKEPTHMMKNGATTLAAAGRRAEYFELPGATHGAYGPEGDRIMRDALTFVLAR